MFLKNINKNIYLKNLKNLYKLGQARIYSLNNKIK